jgi:general secretion pathway protein G
LNDSIQTQFVTADRRHHPRGISLLEIMAVALILAVIVATATYRFLPASNEVRRNACYVIKEEINLQAKLWYREKGAWPNTALSDIGTNAEYFPQGLPTCPFDNTTYQIDGTTHEVTGHVH